MDFKSITAYRESDNFRHIDVDLSDSALLGIPSAGETQSLQQEIQISSNSEHALQWIAGFFYFDDEVKISQEFFQLIPFPYTPSNVAAGAGSFEADSNGRTLESWAVFGEITYNVSERTSVTVGLRYTDEEVALDDDRTVDVMVPNVDLSGFDVSESTTFASANDSFEEPTWSLVLDHRFTDDVMGYVSYKRGFKSGVYNLASPENGVATEPETIDAYELGIKTELLDRTLRLNGSVFYYEYDELQVTVTSGSDSAAIQVTDNAAAAEIRGFDAEAQWIATENLSVELGVSWLDAEYTDYKDATVYVPDPAFLGLLVTEAGDLSNTPLRRTPDYTFNLGTRYELPLDNSSSLVFAANWYYSDGFLLSSSPDIVQDAYDNFSASLTWSSPRDAYYVRLWGDNLTDEEVLSMGGTIEQIGQTANYGPPRTYGITAGMRLGH